MILFKITTKILLFCLLFSVIATNSVLSQALPDSVFNDRKIGIGGYLGSPAVIFSMKADYFLFPFLSIEAGIGLTGNYAGARGYFSPFRNMENVKISFYSGLLLGGYDNAILSSKPDKYYPIGIHFQTPNGFYYSAEMLFKNIGYKVRTHPSAWPGLKAGYRFKF